MITFLIFKLAAVLVPALPRAVAYRLASLLAELNFLISPRHRKNLISNLSRVLGKGASNIELTTTARQVFRAQALNYVDLFSIPHLSSDFWNKNVKIIGKEHFDRAYTAGKGVIVASVHLGNLDLLVQTAASFGIKVTVTIEPINPPKLLELVTGLRASRGVTFVPVSTRGAITAAKTLRRGDVVALACDRDIQDRGIPVSLFGEPAKLPTGAIELAMMTGAAIVPVFGARLAGGNTYTITFKPQVELVEDGERAVERNMERLVSVFEEQISLHPEQWVVFESVWEDDRAPMKNHKPKAVASNSSIKR